MHTQYSMTFHDIWSVTTLNGSGRIWRTHPSMVMAKHRCIFPFLCEAI